MKDDVINKKDNYNILDDKILEDEMLPEYDLSKMKSRPNPYVKDYKNARTFVIDKNGVRRELLKSQLDVLKNEIAKQ